MRVAWLAIAVAACGGQAGGDSTGGTGGSAGAATGGTGATTDGAAGSAGAGGVAGTGNTAGVAGTGNTAGVAGWAACGAPGECIVRPESCCGQCGAATRGDAIGVNAAQQAAYVAIACAGGTGCPECYTPQDPTLLATCAGGACAVADLLELPLTECTADADCRIRTRDCCECGGNTSLEALIAIRADGEAAFTALACDPGQGCDDCLPSYPPPAQAECHAGRCAVIP
jgi:hypothetical protein